MQNVSAYALSYNHMLHCHFMHCLKGLHEVTLNTQLLIKLGVSEHSIEDTPDSVVSVLSLDHRACRHKWTASSWASLAVPSIETLACLMVPQAWNEHTHKLTTVRGTRITNCYSVWRVARC